VSEELFKQAIDLLIIAYEELALTEVNPEKTKYIRKSLMNFDTCLKKFKVKQYIYIGVKYKDVLRMLGKERAL